MITNLDLFKKYYYETKANLDIIIDNYNKDLLKNKEGYLKDNLDLFVNLNSDGKLVRGLLVTLGYKIASKK